MRNIFLLLLIFAPPVACGQAHEILITDTAYIDYRVSEDSTIDFSFKRRKNLKGHWIAYYDESKKKKAVEAAFKKGKLTGTEKQWYENGQLKSESSDVDNKKLWSYKKWYPGGQLYSERTCVNDTCTIDHYYPNGVLMERAIQMFDIKGIRNWFYSATYCDNGQIKFSPPLNPDSHDPQLISTYYCSGSRKEEFTLLRTGNEHLRIGPYLEWFESGAVKIKGYYGDALSETAGVRIGIWNYYNADGKLIKQEEYEDGKLAEVQEY